MSRKRRSSSSGEMSIEKAVVGLVGIAIGVMILWILGAAAWGVIVG